MVVAPTFPPLKTGFGLAEIAAPFAEVAVGEAPSFASGVLERSHDAIIRLISMIKRHFMPGLRLARFTLVANVPSGARAPFWSTMMPSCGTKSAFTHSSPRLAQVHTPIKSCNRAQHRGIFIGK